MGFVITLARVAAGPRGDADLVRRCITAGRSTLEGGPVVEPARPGRDGREDDRGTLPASSPRADAGSVAPPKLLYLSPLRLGSTARERMWSSSLSHCGERQR